MSQEHALVVGAGGAFGTEISRKLISEGLHVVGISRSEESLSELADELGENFLAVAADMSSDEAIDVISAQLSKPVAMVVHAPGLPVAGGIRQADPDILAAAVNIKVGGMLRLIRSAENRMRKGSRLVAIGGHYGFEPTDYAATAGVANAALANVMRQLSWAYGKDGITAHLVAPGPADTERLRNVAAGRAERAGRDIEDELAIMAEESAINAFVDAKQVAWGVATLLAPEADAMAGGTMFLDAGRRRGLP